MRTASFVLGAILLIGWEIVGFLGWMTLYGPIPALLASTTVIANFALPFLTGAWGYLLWGIIGFALVGYGASSAARQDSLR